MHAQLPSKLVDEKLEKISTFFLLFRFAGAVASNDERKKPSVGVDVAKLSLATLGMISKCLLSINQSIKKRTFVLHQALEHSHITIQPSNQPHGFFFCNQTTSFSQREVSSRDCLVKSSRLF